MDGPHPLPRATGVEAWHVEPLTPRITGSTQYGPLWAWRLDDGAVVLQSDDGDVVIPAIFLTSVAQGLLAVHVHNGRPDATPTKGS